MKSLIEKIKQKKDLLIIVSSVLIGGGLLGTAVLTMKGKTNDANTTAVEDTLSYVLGNQIGANLKRQGIAKINAQTLAQAVEDGFNGVNKVSAAEAQKAMQQLQQSLSEQSKKDGDSTLNAARQFMNANKDRAGVVTTRSGLQYLVQKEGKGKSIKKDSVVTMKYHMNLANGAAIDTSEGKSGPSKVKVSSLIEGWQEGLQLMKEGGHMRLYIPPEIAYGKAPTNRIPGNSVIIIDVEVLAVD